MNKTCVIWDGCKDRSGYGKKKINRKVVLVHRWVYQQHHPDEDISEKHICHTCDNPSCINPSHLFSGTRSDNMQDMLRKGRGNKASGEKSGVTVLTSEQVKEIREIYSSMKITQRALAKRYGVSREAISGIITRRNRKYE